MTFYKQTIKQTNVAHKTILLRADYNVPLAEDGTIHDDLRVRASLPTLRYLRSQGCKIIIISHLGRPQGRPVPALSLRPVASRLSQLLHAPVRFVNDCIGEPVQRAVSRMVPGDVLLLENLRFYPQEEQDDVLFARHLAYASQADYFVQDGFGVVHRAHASTSAITRVLPAVAGLLIEREITALTQALARPKRPLYAVLGGAKVSDKIAVIEQLVERADRILLGGVIASTFLAFRGVAMGKSDVEPGQEAIIRRIYTAAARRVGRDYVDSFLVLPVDMAVGHSRRSQRRSVPVQQIGPDDMALDIGDTTLQHYAAYLAGAGTIIWNGTVGYATETPFAHGSARIALAMAQNTSATTVVGGGDTADFVLKWDGHDGASFTHVSTGGGASLDFIAGKPLPGVELLRDLPK